MSADIYNDAILALANSDTASAKIDGPDGIATCDNPLCGDRVTIAVNIDDGRISGVAQTTRGCLLTRAAAAFVVDMARDSLVDSFPGYRHALRAYLRQERDEPPDPKLAIFAPVREVKSRHDCIMIAFDALNAASGQDAVKGKETSH